MPIVRRVIRTPCGEEVVEIWVPDEEVREDDLIPVELPEKVKVPIEPEKA